MVGGVGFRVGGGLRFGKRDVVRVFVGEDWRKECF